MSDIKPLNWITKTLARLSYLSLGFQVIYSGRSCSLSRQGHCIAMLASGVSLPGMRSGWVWRHGRYSTWTPQKPTLFGGHYLRNRSTLDIGVLGYIGIVQHKEHSPEVLSIPPGVLCIYHVLSFPFNSHRLSSFYQPFIPFLRFFSMLVFRRWVCWPCGQTPLPWRT